MKRILTIRKLYSGQAVIIFFVILCLVAGSIIATNYLHRVNSGADSAGLLKQEKPDTACVMKPFPYSRYYNEVLMY